MSDRSEEIERIESIINTLLETAWEDTGFKLKNVQNWYKQFEESEDPEQDEQIQFLFLLSKFLYFGKKEMMEMMRSLYRDLYKYPTIHDIRKKNGNTLNEDFLNEEFKRTLNRTRFLGIGNPSDSGSYMLYKFRQANDINKNLFIHSHEIFSLNKETDDSGRERQVANINSADVDHYIFIDDLTCTGSQARQYSEEIVAPIKELNPKAKVHYFVLVATEHALIHLRHYTAYDNIDCVFKLDETFKCFDSKSRYYKNEKKTFDRTYTETKCRLYDTKLQHPSYQLGFGQSQLLLSFEHNTPDNVPPIFWSEGQGDYGWEPIFKRYHKKYS